MFQIIQIIGFLSCADSKNSNREKEKPDESSPRGVIDAFERDAQANKSFNENSKTSSPQSRRVFNWSKILKLLIKKSVKRLASFPPVGMPRLSRGKSTRSKSSKEGQMFCILNNFENTVVNFTYAELEAATNYFSAGMIQNALIVRKNRSLLSLIVMLYWFLDID